MMMKEVNRDEESVHRCWVHDDNSRNNKYARPLLKDVSAQQQLARCKLAIAFAILHDTSLKFDGLHGLHDGYR